MKTTSYNVSRQRFKLNAIALAIASISSTAVIAEEGVQLEKVQVVGQAAQISKALNEQRQSHSIKSVVHSDGIGQLPDDNAAEALQRLPGVSVENDQGEGRFVTIRGLAPELNSVTINGTLIPAPEAGTRAVALDVLPAELVQSLSVVKTLTPDMDANSLGGTIEVKTLSGFDHDGLFYTVTGEASHDTNVSETSPKFSGAASNLFEFDNGGKLGVAAALSWQDRDFGSDNVEADGNWDDLDTASPVLNEFEMRDYVITRKRSGLGLNFDYQTADNANYFLRTQYSEFKDSELRQRAKVVLEDDETERDLKDREETQTIGSFTLGGEQRFGTWTMAAQASYARSDEENPDYFSSNFVNGSTTNSFTGTKKPRIDPAANFADASSYEFDELELTKEKTTDTQKSFQLDLAKDYMWNNYDATVKFGGKVSRREKDNDVNVFEYDADDSLTLADFSNGTVDYSLGNFGPSISSSAIRNWAAGETATLLEGDSLIEDYEMEENISAAYIMNTLDLDNWTVIAGVRYEHTDFEAKGINYDADAEVIVGTVNADKDYGNWLPALHARYYISDDTQLRMAYTQSVVRPTFEALAPSIEADGTDEAVLGDPTLDPLESDNIDFGFEHYMGKTGAASVFVFHKDIKNFVYKAELDDYGIYDSAETFVNGDEADVFGVEFAYTQKLDWLPSPWNGLIVGANFTVSTSDAEISANGSTRKISLPGQSDRVGNAMLGWENDKLSMRVSANYKSNYLSEVGNVEDASEDVYVDDQTFVDLSASYFFTKNMQLTFEAKNITDEPFYRYVGDERYNTQYEEYGPSYKLSFTLTNF